MWQKCWNSQNLIHHLRFRERGPLKSWRPETMAEAIFSVLKEGLSLSQAARKYDIPYPTFVLYANRVHNMLGPSIDGGTDLRPKGRGRPQRILLGIWPDDHIKGVIKSVVFRDAKEMKEEPLMYGRHSPFPFQDNPLSYASNASNGQLPAVGTGGAGSSVPDGMSPDALTAATVAAVRQQMCNMVAAAQHHPDAANLVAAASGFNLPSHCATPSSLSIHPAANAAAAVAAAAAAAAAASGPSGSSTGGPSGGMSSSSSGSIPVPKLGSPAVPSSAGGHGSSTIGGGGAGGMQIPRHGSPASAGKEHELQQQHGAVRSVCGSPLSRGTPPGGGGRSGVGGGGGSGRSLHGAGAASSASSAVNHLQHHSHHQHHHHHHQQQQQQHPHHQQGHQQHPLQHHSQHHGHALHQHQHPLAHLVGSAVSSAGGLSITKLGSPGSAHDLRISSSSPQDDHSPLASPITGVGGGGGGGGSSGGLVLEPAVNLALGAAGRQTPDDVRSLVPPPYRSKPPSRGGGGAGYGPGMVGGAGTSPPRPEHLFQDPDIAALVARGCPPATRTGSTATTDSYKETASDVRRPPPATIKLEPLTECRGD
uniref:Uncharacterized protein n=3 Tax=Anopheles albimanus TaxID=7167 RepID=A0A182FCQ4_ANOAL